MTHSSTNIRVVVDTNVFISLEDNDETPDLFSESAAEFARLAARLGIPILVCQASRRDILSALPPKRGKRFTQLARYALIADIPLNQTLATRAGYRGALSDNDRIDLEILNCLDSNAASWLVTEDVRLRNHAAKAGFENRVFSISEVIGTLRKLTSQPSPVSTVSTRKGYEIQLSSGFFDSLRADYPGFDEWWLERVNGEERDVLVLGSPTDPEGIAALKRETDAIGDLCVGVLNVKPFKTSESLSGSARGELLLRGVVEYARSNAFRTLAIEVRRSKEALIGWLDVFGFRSKMQIDDESILLVKELFPSPEAFEAYSALEINRVFGPGALKLQNAHFVPIQHHWHRRLFPEAEIQTSLMPRAEPCGNAIRKAYICNANTRLVRKGDTLLFYRTGHRPRVQVVGAVEATLRTSEPTSLAEFVGKRTAYSYYDIQETCLHREALAILFRYDRELRQAWSFDDLRRAGALSQSPQSIQQVNVEAMEWIRWELEGSF